MKLKLILLSVFLLVSTTTAAAEYRVITVDGDIADWDGIPPLVTDPKGDYDFSPSEDIKAVYTANDNNNLYFWMEMQPIEIKATLQDANFYKFFIDIIPGEGEPLSGADYYISFVVGGTQIANNIDSSISLFIWDGGWISALCEGLEGAASEGNIEVSVPWECVGGEACISTYFTASTSIPGTDYAPDSEGKTIILVDYCPCEEPVGGLLLPVIGPFSLLKIVAYLTIIAATIRLSKITIRH